MLCFFIIKKKFLFVCLFLTIYVFESYFRTLPIIFVSDFVVAGVSFVLFLVYCLKTRCIC